jgi:hypothetical protein
MGFFRALLPQFKLIQILCVIRTLDTQFFQAAEPTTLRSCIQSRHLLASPANPVRFRDTTMTLSRELLCITVHSRFIAVHSRVIAVKYCGITVPP